MISCALRATRRAKPAGKPCAIVCGRMEIESAPPDAAAKQAIVVRRMLVSGSMAVIMRNDVSEWILAVDLGIEQVSCTRAQILRSARTLATDRNWSWSTLSAKP